MSDQPGLPQTVEEQASSNGVRPMLQLSEPDPALRPARLALYVGIALAAVGAVVLYLGYNGAATNSLPQAQTPYVISGGLLGVGLMVIGTVVIALHVLLRVQADFRAEIAETRRALEEIGESFARQAVLGGTAATPSTNGTVMVTKSSSSYHRPDCRLVARAGHARPLAREEAGLAGLTPCRICRP